MPGQEEQEDGEEKGHAEDNEGRRIQEVRHLAYRVAAVLRLQDGVRIKQAAVDLPSKPCTSVGGGGFERWSPTRGHSCGGMEQRRTLAVLEPQVVVVFCLPSAANPDAPQE